MDRNDIVQLNSFATECFRDIADADYISARANYKMGLAIQFQWAALQAIEKYLKAILLYNQKKTTKLGHDIEKALRRVDSISDFKLDIDERDRSFIKHLNSNAQNRYLEQDAYSLGHGLLDLDSTVWSLRRYCKVLNYEITANGKTVNMLQHELAQITSSYYKDNPHKFRILGGVIEKTLAKNKNDELRKMLVWKNFKYGKNRKNKLNNYIFQTTSYTPPHFRKPEYFNLFSEYVTFPGKIKDQFKK